MKNKIMYIQLIILAILIISYVLIKNKPHNNDNEILTKNTFLLGTIIDIKIYDKEADDNILNGAIDILKDVENKMSKNIKATEVSAINENAGISSVKVSEDTFYVIEKSIDYAKLSNGYFDITIGPLVELWNIGTEHAKVPTIEHISNALSNINMNNLQLNQSNKDVKLLNENMKIDLGAIAKGYATDKLLNYFKSNSINSAIINLGGNIFVLGNNPNSDYWNVGIQNPFGQRGGAFAKIKAKNKSIVTSGIYERYFEENGVKYHHILNPFTGYPIENQLASVTIISDYSIDGDALSTSAFSLGLENGLSLIESLENIDGIFVTKDKKVYVSSGISKSFTILDNDFKLEH